MDETQRIRSVYQRRDAAGKPGLYAWHRSDVLLNQFTFFSAMSRILEQQGFADLQGKEILDVGCGTGGWLRRLLDWGGEAERLHGIDLIESRIDVAHRQSPQLDIRLTDGVIPYADESMDLVFASTVFSSILDADARMQLAWDMRRVMRHDGIIVIYDFRISDPRNHDTVGITKREIGRIFPDMVCHMKSATLAPPINRFVSRYSPWLAYSMERGMPFLRTHAFYSLNGRGKT